MGFYIVFRKCVYALNSAGLPIIRQSMEGYWGVSRRTADMYIYAVLVYGTFVLFVFCCGFNFPLLDCGSWYGIA